MCENFSMDGINTFVALPLETTDNNFIQVPAQSDQLRVVKNYILKTLSDGSICLTNANDGSTNASLDTQQLVMFDNGNIFLSNIGDLSLNPENLQTVTASDELTDIVVDINMDLKSQKPPSPMYKCPKCQDSFNKVALYRKHMSWHRDLKKFKCDKCLAGYNIESNLKIHMAMHAEGKPNCPVCNLSFQRTASLKSHLMLHQVEEFYNCEECSAEFEKEEELDRHLQNHLSNARESNNLVCNYCKVKFADSRSYKEHVSHHVKVKKMVLSGKKSRKTHGHKDHRHMCPVCQKTFSKTSLLERHLRVHSGERPFVCNVCCKGFNQKGTLQIHLNKHKGIKPFHCTLCTAKFNQKGNLRVHVEKTHTAPQPGVKTYKCAHCTCIFKKVASLNVHVTKTHATDERTAHLEAVIENLKELDAVQQEKEKSDKENFEKLFEKGDGTSYVRLAESFLDGSVKRYLVKQKKVNDVRFYICGYCCKEFKKPSDLIRHTRVHTREKPFGCKQCGASFSLKSTLHCHSRIHLTGHHHQCMLCKKKFSSVKTLNLHLKKHSEKRVLHYKCTVCNKLLPSVQKARLHQATHANNPSDSIQTVVLKQPLIAQLSENSVKNYSCKACPKKFINLSSLKRHGLSHASKSVVDHVTAHETAINQSDPALNVTRGAEDEIRTVLVNCDDLQLSSDQNLYAQLKLQSADSLFLNHLSDLPDAGNVFNIDGLNSDEIYGANQIFNVVSGDQSNIPTISELTNKIFKLESVNQSASTNHKKISESDGGGDGPYISNSDINLFLNLDSDLSENLNLPEIALGEVPGLVAPESCDRGEKVEKSVKENIHGKEEWFDCDKCGKNFANRNVLKKHLKSHATTLNLPNSNNNNLSNKVGIATHNCDYCHKEFKKKSDLIRHVRSHTGERPFACDKCDRKFSLKSTLQSHQRTHNPVNPKTYSCAVCNSCFTSKSSLKVHMSMHTGVKQHACTYCDMKFRTTWQRKTHENSFHLNPAAKKPKSKITNLLESVALEAFTSLSEPSQAEMSNERTNSQLLENVLVIQEPLHIPGEDLNILNEPHQNLSVDSMILQQIPPSNFLFQDQLLPTSLIQLDDGTLLNIKTVTAENLKQNQTLIFQDPSSSVISDANLAAPPPEKPRNLECEVCHKRYASKDVFRKHKKTHGIYRKFPCGKCDKGFDTEEDLEKHQMVHAGLRPFSCMYCTNSFTKKHGLTTHIKRIHMKSVGGDINESYFLA